MSLRTPTLLLPLLPLFLSACDISGLVLPAGGDPAPAAVRAPASATGYEPLALAVARAAADRDRGALEPLITRRLAASIDQAMPNNGERFWRHLDRLRRGIEGGFTIPTPIRRDDGRLEVPLRFSDGSQASLIVTRERGQPRIDRF